MHGFCTIGSFFGSAILGLAIICATILFALKMRHGGLTQKDRQYDTEEARMIQEIFLGLERMEKRVESLETILLERQEAPDQKKG